MGRDETFSRQGAAALIVAESIQDVSSMSAYKYHVQGADIQRRVGVVYRVGGMLMCCKAS
jgi:hypothetical protein